MRPRSGRTALRVNLVDPGPLRTRLRAQAYPGEDPPRPEPATAAEAFLALAEPGCARHGERLGPDRARGRRPRLKQLKPESRVSADIGWKRRPAYRCEQSRAAEAAQPTESSGRTEVSPQGHADQRLRANPGRAETPADRLLSHGRIRARAGAAAAAGRAWPAAARARRWRAAARAAQLGERHDDGPALLADIGVRAADVQAIVVWRVPLARRLAVDSGDGSPVPVRPRAERAARPPPHGRQPDDLGAGA